MSQGMGGLMKNRMMISCFSIFLILVSARTAFADEGNITVPLHVRNLYPPIMMFFDPVPDSALRNYNNWDISLDQHLANIYQFNQWPLDRLLVDTELYVADVTVRKSFLSDFELSLRFTLLRPYNGFLDQMIKEIHKLLQAPPAGRLSRPNNTFAYYFRPGAGAGWQGRNSWAIGDSVLSLRKQLFTGDYWGIAGLAALKLPTGVKHLGWSSGQPDLAIGTVASLQAANWFSHVELWGIYPFAKSVPGTKFLPKRVTPYTLGWDYHLFMRGSVALGWKSSDHLSLILQVQGGTSPYSSGLLQLDSDILLISFGLQGETDARTGWSIVLTENGLNQLTTQDISITMGLHWPLSI
jgi:hypothetical protein